MARPFVPQVATGNDLLQGDVVYFTAAGGWSRDHADSAVAFDQPDADTLLAKASAFPNQYVGIYLADCAVGADGKPVPTHFRETFRTRGPSNYPSHGKQAEA